MSTVVQDRLFLGKILGWFFCSNIENLQHVTSSGDRIPAVTGSLWLSIRPCDSVSSASVLLTCAVDTIAGESLIAFAPVTPGPRRGAQVRCNRSTSGVRMTDSWCIGSAAPWIWFNIYTRQYRPLHMNSGNVT